MAPVGAALDRAAIRRQSQNTVILAYNVVRTSNLNLFFCRRCRIKWSITCILPEGNMVLVTLTTHLLHPLYSSQQSECLRGERWETSKQHPTKRNREVLSAWISVSTCLTTCVMKVRTTRQTYRGHHHCYKLLKTTFQTWRFSVPTIRGVKINLCEYASSVGKVIRLQAGGHRSRSSIPGMGKNFSLS
jgi:hypothetical protein